MKQYTGEFLDVDRVAEEFNCRSARSSALEIVALRRRINELAAELAKVTELATAVDNIAQVHRRERDAARTEASDLRRAFACSEDFKNQANVERSRAIADRDQAIRERDAAIALGRAEREAARVERESLIAERDEAREKYAKLVDRFWDKSIPPATEHYQCRCLPIAHHLDDEWVGFTPADVIAQMKAIGRTKRDREVAATVTPRTVDPATGIVWSEAAKRAAPKWHEDPAFRDALLDGLRRVQLTSFADGFLRYPRY